MTLLTAEETYYIEEPTEPQKPHIYDEITDSLSEPAAKLVTDTLNKTGEIRWNWADESFVTAAQELKEKGVIWETPQIGYYRELLEVFLIENPNYNDTKYLKGLEKKREYEPLTSADSYYLHLVAIQKKYRLQKEMFIRAGIHHALDEVIHVIHPSFQSYWMAKVA